MSSLSPDLTQECSRCNGALAPTALVCGNCHALVHAARLEQLAAGARLHEERHENIEARNVWLNALELLPPDMPVFLPGFGAYVRWSALGVSAQTRAFVSLAGPMAGCIGAAVCALLWLETGDAFWIGLASLSALLNVLNLIPIWVLDGGQ